ncbi:hypothetical protein BDD43_5183 [Mucilaginibacter gracilis]|uniref:DUF4382 domain-containing protein n=1 Tax=Mucilaginibacter gracilis TaxID=423350 RepID=A0A495J7F9_9SPHI|nr:hypothetical protein [Mucilaginibacter gracilis]RKR84930.1 hypothetical protein BDD43_5183 [Mucilaginibacter gracilis]
MKKCLSHFTVVVMVICVLFAGCKKTDVTPTASDPQLTFALIPDSQLITFGAAKTEGGLTPFTTTKQTFSWYAGTANITKFRLNAKRGDVASEYSSGAISNVDLFATASLLSTINITKGDYTLVKATVVFTQTPTAPYPLVLQGTYTTSNSTAVPLEFDLNDNLEVSVPLANIIADGTKDFTTNIAMHLNAFLSNVTAQEIDGATRTNGVILISKTINTALYNKIKANMLICSAGFLFNKPK